MIALGIVGFLIVLVIALYSIGREDSSPSFIDGTSSLTDDNGDVTTGSDGAVGNALPDLAGQAVETAVQSVNQTGASYVLIGVREGDVPVNTVVDQSPGPGTAVGPGDTVTIYYQR
jgi:beta-lactam-binding protein with PASTA domain